MGMVSDRLRSGGLQSLFMKNASLLISLAYIAGIVGFLALGHPSLIMQTYFSENALLAGVVEDEYMFDSYAEKYYQELIGIRKKSRKEMPISWLYEKFSELGLETYTHNFSFTYPYKIVGNSVISSQNVYSVMRAPRAASTEALLLAVPYRTPESPFPQKTHGGIALALSLARYFKAHPYWAKDIIFLITDYEGFGMQAWLNAYHGIESAYIFPEDLEARGGALQAALVLELPSNKLTKLDLRYVGLNGQLPNLDYLNLVVRLCEKHGVQPSVNNLQTPIYNLSQQALYNPHQEDPQYDRYLDDQERYFRKMQIVLSGVYEQLSCQPNGQHGFINKYNVEALTLFGVREKGKGHSVRMVGFDRMGMVVEGIFRGLNNLLERFHQSFFFYLMAGTHEFLSIGVYMPPFGLLVLPSLLHALWIYLKAGSSADPTKSDGDNTSADKASKPESDQGQDSSATAAEGAADSKTEVTVSSSAEGASALSMLPTLIICVVFGLCAYRSPGFLIESARAFKMPPDEALFMGNLALFISSLAFPRALYRRTVDTKLCAPTAAQKCFALLAHALIVGCTGICNISLALVAAALTTPVYNLIAPRTRLYNFLQMLLLLLVSPLALLIYIAAFETYRATGSVEFTETFRSSKSILLAGIISNETFHNWLFLWVSALYYPTWLLFWSLFWTRDKPLSQQAKAADESSKKDN